MNIAVSNSHRVLARNNPFAVEKTDAIPFDFSETPFDCLESFHDHIKPFKFRGAIMGKHGRGKTTLLCDLHSFLCAREIDCELLFSPRERNQQRNFIDSIVSRGRSGAILLVDGIERLPFLQRQRLISRSKQFNGFIATTHRPSRLRTLIHCKTSSAKLHRILKSANLSSPKVSHRAAALFTQHRGNIRSVLRDLYDEWADGIFA